MEVAFHHEHLSLVVVIAQLLVLKLFFIKYSILGTGPCTLVLSYIEFGYICYLETQKGQIGVKLWGKLAVYLLDCWRDCCDCLGRVD